jgi:hypothetical protein
MMRMGRSGNVPASAAVLTSPANKAANRRFMGVLRVMAEICISILETRKWNKYDLHYISVNTLEEIPDARCDGTG